MHCNNLCTLSFAVVVLAYHIMPCHAYIPEPGQQLGIYSQAPAAGYFNYGAPSIYAYRYKRSYYAGTPSTQPVYGGYSGVGSSNAQYGSLPYGSGSTNNLYGSSGTNSYNPLPAAVSYVGGGGAYGGYGYRKKRSAYQEPYQQLGIYSQAPAAGDFNYGAPSIYAYRYKRSYYSGTPSAQPVYGGNNYGSGYGGVGQSYSQLGSLPYGSGSTNNLYGSSGTNSFNPLGAAVSYY